MRSHDPEEAIRHDVIVSIVTASKKDLSLVNDHLLNFVRERTLDKRVSSYFYLFIYLLLPFVLCFCCCFFFSTSTISDLKKKKNHQDGEPLLPCDISAFGCLELISSAVSLELHSISLPNLICSLFGPPGRGGQMKYIEPYSDIAVLQPFQITSAVGGG